MKSQFYYFISVAAIASYFVPAILVVWKKLLHVTPFMLFAGYWLLNGFVNLVAEFPGVGKRTLEVIGVVYNAIDVPLILGIFYLATHNPLIRKITLIAVPLFCCIEVISLIGYGIHYDSLKYTLGIGLLLVLTILIWEIVGYLTKVEHSRQEDGLIFVHAALLFEYGTYVVIYIFDYYLQSASNTIDNFLVYYISNFIALSIAAVGFLTKGIKPDVRIR